jgi:hypothetical protein
MVYEPLGRATSSLCARLRTKAMPKHYRPCSTLADQALVAKATDKLVRSPEEGPQWYRPNAR